MTPVGDYPWAIEIGTCTWLWSGRRLRMFATLINRTTVACIPEPRRLRPVVRDLHNNALASSDIYRPEAGRLIVFRPVVQPGEGVHVRFQFERLPNDRLPVSLTLGDITGSAAAVSAVLPEIFRPHRQPA